MNSTRCRLLELPAELRNTIWTLAVSINQHRQVDFRQPALSRVCRQIRTEALPVFYGTTTFVIDHFHTDHGKWKQWLKSIAKHAELIRHLKIQTPVQAHFMDSIVRKDDLSVGFSIGDDGVIEWSIAAEGGFTWKCSMLLGEAIHDWLHVNVPRLPCGKKDTEDPDGIEAEDWVLILGTLETIINDYERGFLNSGYVNELFPYERNYALIRSHRIRSERYNAIPK